MVDGLGCWWVEEVGLVVNVVAGGSRWVAWWREVASNNAVVVVEIVVGNDAAMSPGLYVDPVAIRMCRFVVVEEPRIGVSPHRTDRVFGAEEAFHLGQHQGFADGLSPSRSCLSHLLGDSGRSSKDLMKSWHFWLKDWARCGSVR